MGGRATCHVGEERGHTQGRWLYPAGSRVFCTLRVLHCEETQSEVGRHGCRLLTTKVTLALIHPLFCVAAQGVKNAVYIGYSTALPRKIVLHSCTFDKSTQFQR